MRRNRDGDGHDHRVGLSHWHEDHWAHLDLFEDLPLGLHRADAPPLANLNTFFEWYGITGEQAEAWRPVMEKQFHFRPRQPDHFLDDVTVVDLAGHTVEVVHSPGHTPGHLCFYFRESDTLFLGDIDLTRFGPWYGDRYSNIDDFIASVRRVRKIGARHLIGGHETGLIEDVPAELWTDYLEVVQKRERALCDYLTSPLTLEEVAAQWIVYGRAREPQDFYMLGERSHMEKHLCRLVNKGPVGVENNRYHLRNNL